MLKVRIASEYMQLSSVLPLKLSVFPFCVLVTVSENGEASSDAYYKPTLSKHNSDSSKI